MKQSFNRTKIVATVGPASSNKEMLTKLVDNGVDVFRLNFSHGSHEDKAAIIKLIKEINKPLISKVAILCDLQGPKIRLGDLKEGNVTINTGDSIEIVTNKDVNSSKKIYINYPNLAKEVKLDDRILIDDGKFELRVIASDGAQKIKAKVIYGGELKPRKGVNLPDTSLSVPSLTKKDLKDLAFILKQEIDWIALSFVRSENDLIYLKKLINEGNHTARVIAKIEKPEALINIKKIIKETDAVMVARGDLGVEVAGERVPLIQKDIVRRCLRANKPVIIATQMMESMIDNPKATRAEINDVANAVLDGADAVMLSGETAVGKYPVEVIQNFSRILNEVEQKGEIYNKNLKSDKTSETFLSDAVCITGCRIADEVNAKAIIGLTTSGYTAFMVSSRRPHANIYIFTGNKALLGTLSLLWGVRTIFYDEFKSTDETVEDVKTILKKHGVIRKGDKVVNLGSMPVSERGRTNMLRVSIIE